MIYYKLISQLIESVKAQFHDIGANVDIFHEKWYKVALRLQRKLYFIIQILFL